MNTFQILGMGLGRALLSVIFILSSVNKILDWHGTEQYMLNTLFEWLRFLPGNDMAQNWIHDVIKWAPALLIISTALELIGGILVFIGYRVKLGATLLILFIIPVTLIMHHFWFLQGADRVLQMTMFLKNISILGGLIIVLSQAKKQKQPRND